MKFFLKLLIVYSCFVSGCTCSDEPQKNKKSEKDKCRVIYGECSFYCNSKKNVNNCMEGCNSGLNACNTNIENDQPGDWQPIDAFYDGCIDVMPDAFSSACSY